MTAPGAAARVPALGLGIPASQVLARPAKEVAAFASDAVGRGFSSLWVLAGDAAQSRVLPLTAAAVGVAAPTIRMGVRLVFHEDLIRMAEDLAVLDNVLGGRLEVAFAAAGPPGSPSWSALVRVRALAELLAGSPVRTASSGGGRPPTVRPPPAQRLVPGVWFEERAALSDVLAALRAGIPAAAPRVLAGAVPRSGVQRGRAWLIEVLGPRDHPAQPAAPAASSRVLLASMDGAADVAAARERA